jgi:hypothetical protein
MTDIKQWVRLYLTALITGVRMESVRMRHNVYEIQFFDSADKCFLAFVLSPQYPKEDK